MDKLIQIYSNLDPVTELFVALMIVAIAQVILGRLCDYLFPKNSNQPQKF